MSDMPCLCCDQPQTDAQKNLLASVKNRPFYSCFIVSVPLDDVPAFRQLAHECGLRTWWRM